MKSSITANEFAQVSWGHIVLPIFHFPKLKYL